MLRRSSSAFQAALLFVLVATTASSDSTSPPRVPAASPRSGGGALRGSSRDKEGGARSSHVGSTRPRKGKDNQVGADASLKAERSGGPAGRGGGAAGKDGKGGPVKKYQVRSGWLPILAKGVHRGSVKEGD